jgi:RecG-like helicase
LQAGNLTLGIADVVRDNEILKIARTDAFTFMKHKIQGV